MSYWYYRLADTNANRTSTTTTRLRCTLKMLVFTMKDFTFTGGDLILILAYLSRLVEEADMRGMNEGKLMVCLPLMLAKNTECGFRSSSSGNRTNGLAYWPKSVEYFL